MLKEVTNKTDKKKISTTINNWKFCYNIGKIKKSKNLKVTNETYNYTLMAHNFSDAREKKKRVKKKSKRL